MAKNSPHPPEKSAATKIATVLRPSDQERHLAQMAFTAGGRMAGTKHRKWGRPRP